MKHIGFALVLASIAAFTGCSPDSSSESRGCVPGAAEMCICGPNATGFHVCDMGIWEPCQWVNPDGGVTLRDAGPTSDGSTHDSNDPVKQPDGGKDTATGTPDAKTQEPDAVPHTNHVPKILSLRTNGSLIKDTQSLVVTAIVTDPDGIDDLIGGGLVSKTGVGLGAFTTAAAEGSYEIRLTFAEVASSLEMSTEFVPGVGPADSVPISLTAQFFDALGASTEQSINVSFECSESGEGERICDGSCVSVDGYDSEDHIIPMWRLR